jgi:RNA polymerase sigma factor (sigma-70 family)
MRAIPIPARPAATPLRSKRLLALAGDERLVEQIRRGSEAAFEVAFERHGPGILGFCRHMLGSPEEAEDAVQHTFAAAHRTLLRDDRPVVLKPWLYTIARNRCMSVLRARREEQPEPDEIATAGLAEQVEQRAELREIVRDIHDLPEDQRAALLLSELGDLSHAEVADVLGCEAARVKQLVFRARSGLIARREARETPCEQIREQLATLRGGSLRRTELRHHLRRCDGCREFREQLRQQRALLGVALPVVPSLGLKASVLAAIGVGGAGGGAAGGGGAALGGLAGAVATQVTGTAAKIAVVGAVAGGSVVGGGAVVDGVRGGDPPPPREDVPGAVAPAEAHESEGRPERPSTGALAVAPPSDPIDREDRPALTVETTEREGATRRGFERRTVVADAPAAPRVVPPGGEDHAGPPRTGGPAEPAPPGRENLDVQPPDQSGKGNAQNRAGGDVEDVETESEDPPIPETEPQPTVPTTPVTTPVKPPKKTDKPEKRHGDQD